MTTTDLIDELADQVEHLIGSGRVLTLRIEPGDTFEQRQAVIDAHGEVLDELRRRGYYDVRATITRIGEGELDPDGMPLTAGEHLAIGFAPEEAEEQAGL